MNTLRHAIAIEEKAKKHANEILRPTTRQMRGQAAMAMVGSVDEQTRLFSMLADNSVAEEGGRMLDCTTFFEFIKRLAVLVEDKQVGYQLQTRSVRQLKHASRVNIYEFKERA